MRMAARQALMNNTLAEDRVYDSDNTPLADALQQESKPYITVYTDEDNRLDIEGRQLYVSNRNLSLTIEIGVASAVTLENGQSQVVIPPTDEGMELTIDVVEDQARAALFGDPKNPWGEILRRLVLRILRVPSQRGSSAERGARWAARQVTFICDLIADSPAGIVLAQQHVLRDFITMAQSSTPTMQAAATVVEAVLNKTVLPDWRQDQGWLGMSTEEIRAMGIAPLPEGDEEPHKYETVDFTDIEWEGVIEADESADTAEMEAEIE